VALSDHELEPFRQAFALVTGEAGDRPDPVRWAGRRLGEKLYAKQREVCMSVADNRRTAVPSAFDTGKSFSASRLAAWWIDTHPPGEAIVVTTATTHAQVRAILWQEIGAAHRKSKLLPGHVNQTEWWIGDILVGFGRRPRDWSPDAFTGIHRPYVLVIIDEASGVPKAIFDACEGLITNADSRILAIGNPYAPDSHFAHICRPGSPWNTIRISAFDTPAYTGEPMPDIAMRSLISKVWVDENTLEWGKDSPLYVTKILGKFPDESDDQLLPLSWVQAAIDHEEPVESNHPTLGVDVARYGEDETVIAGRWGWHHEIVETFRRKPITYTTGAAARLARELESRDVRVDGDGLGAGVVDGLREQGIKVDDLHNGARATDPGKFINARSQWWWELRMGFEERLPDIPNDPILAGQLTAIHWSLDSKGRIAIETKDEMRKRGVRSPDRADALMYTHAASHKVAPVVAPVATPQASYVNP
jgi:hypothetical protein